MRPPRPVARPALDRRAKMAERQPFAARRRSTRVLSRVAVLMIFDAAMLLVARALGFLVPAPAALVAADRTLIAGPLAAPGAPASLVFVVSLMVALVLSGSYARHRPLVVALRIALATVVAATATAVALATLVGVRAAALHAASFALLCIPLLGAGRVLGQSFLSRVWPRDRGALPAALISGDARTANPGRFWGDYVIVSEVEIDRTTTPHDVVQRLHDLHMAAPEGVEAIISTDGLRDDLLGPVVEAALDAGARVIFPARALGLTGINPRLIWHRGQPFFEVSTPALRTSAVFTKRTFDGVGAALLLLAAAPLMAVIAAAIKLGSPGPVFFFQERAGLGGVPFRMLKFRTMRVGADEEKQNLAHLNRSGDVRLFKIPSDPRVTGVGLFLRRWSLDELPQLINVLKGDMSLVGPRPFFESDFASYEDRHFRRLDTKPGITGLWQVSGRSEVVNFDDVVFLDRQYIEQWSIWLDLSILFRTISAVARRTGAY